MGDKVGKPVVCSTFKSFAPGVAGIGKKNNGLAARVQEALLLDPLPEQLFAITHRRRTRVKVLYWERNGFVLWLQKGLRGGLTG